MKKFLSIFAAMFAAVALNAAVINIDTSSADALRHALNDANDGDEIVMAEGLYVESNGNYIAFDGKHVTVKAAEGANVIIQPQVPITIAEGGTAHFVGVKFDASHLNDLADWYEHLIYPADGGYANHIILEGCEFYGFNINKSMIHCSESNQLASISINNCYFHNCKKSILFIQNEANSVDVSVTNSTFANIETEASSYYAGVLDSRAPAGAFVVDHCTFYNVQVMNTDYAAVGKVKSSVSTVANSIFMLPVAQDGIRAIRDVANAINCITFNYSKDSGTGIHSSVAKTNCDQVDPAFVDPDNGNFTLGEGSPALTMNDGEPIGDPRWTASEEPAEPNFYVAGSMTSWGDNMIPVYENSYTLKDLAAGTYQLKVVDGDQWIGFSALTEKTPGLFEDDWGNVNFTLGETGDVTVTYIKGEVFKLEGNFIMPSVTLAGSMNEWNATAEGYAFTPAEDKLTASLTVTLNDYYYEFKVVVSGALWMGKETGGNYFELNRQCTQVDGLVADKPNLVIRPDVVPGEYTFVWTYAENRLEVIFPIWTGIENTAVEATAVKRIENGMLVIEKAGVRYNVIGQIME